MSWNTAFLTAVGNGAGAIDKFALLIAGGNVSGGESDSNCLFPDGDTLIFNQISYTCLHQGRIKNQFIFLRSSGIHKGMVKGKIYLFQKFYAAVHQDEMILQSPNG